jgi:hypothetical protein
MNALRKSNSVFSKFYEKQKLNPSCRKLDLASFLIKPVQRMYKYPLFFREILKYTPISHPYHAALQSAHDKVNEIATKVNVMKGDAAAIDRVYEISKILHIDNNSFELVDRKRRFIFDAKTHTSSNSDKLGQIRWIIIFSDILVVAKQSSVLSKKHFTATKLIILKDIIDVQLLPGKPTVVFSYRAISGSSANIPIGSKDKEVIYEIFNFV